MDLKLSTWKFSKFLSYILKFVSFEIISQPYFAIILGL
jgi:hypothetical protein